MLICAVRGRLLESLIHVFNRYFLLSVRNLQLCLLSPTRVPLSADFTSYEGITNILLNLKMKSSAGPNYVSHTFCATMSKILLAVFELFVALYFYPVSYLMSGVFRELLLFINKAIVYFMEIIFLYLQLAAAVKQ